MENKMHTHTWVLQLSIIVDISRLEGEMPQGSIG